MSTTFPEKRKMNFMIVIISTLVYTNGLIVDDQTQEFVSARCYSKCLKIFIRFKSANKNEMSKSVTGQSTTSPGSSHQLAFVDEIAHILPVTQLSLLSCLEDEHNQCSRQCFKWCTMTSGDCICQLNDIGCLLACHYRKEIAKEGSQEECPLTSNIEESALKVPISRCPKTCKSKLECGADQLCCGTETCGPICLQINDFKSNFPKYTPTPTVSSTTSNIEFDWSDTFSNHLKDESPLVFILQTRTCLCNKWIIKYLTTWQTLIMTHRLGVKLNALDNGTIYQFRLAAVSVQGTNGFGSISQNLPSVISRPSPPFPPDNLLEYKWQVTHENFFRVEVKWIEPRPSFWRNYDYLVSWMIDHGVLQSGGEPMSSFTQYTKVLPGTDHHTTIENLRSSTTYKIQIATKVDWPGYGDIMSDPRTIYVTTPTTSASDHSSENFIVNSESKPCSCPDHKTEQPGIRIRPANFINGDLQITINMEKYSDYMVDIYPEVCINYVNENHSQNQNNFRKISKQTSEILLENLQFNCRYSLEITNLLKTTSKHTYQLCFCTPPCHKTYHGRNCLKDDVSIIPSPRGVKYALYNYDTMTYKVSWEAMQNNVRRGHSSPDIAKYRVLWAPRRFEPVPLDHYNGPSGFDPIFDLERSDVRIIKSNITLLLLHNLTKDQLYIVRVQSIAISESGQFLESYPITILLPTHGYSELYYHNSQTNLVATRPLILIVLRLTYELFRIIRSL